jgi:phosphatidylglycerophosphate synthase
MVASAGITQLAGLVALLSLAWAGRVALSLGQFYPLKAGVLFAIVAATALVLVRQHHPFARFGPANQITTLRAVLVALVASLIGEPGSPAIAAGAATLALVATMMDGLDGWLARRTRMASAFGARFDMEVDALLVLALAVLAWQHDKAGAWVLMSGLMRYLFLSAGWEWRWLRRPLPPSVRRQAICVVQILGLMVVMVPVVRPPLSGLLAAAALAALAGSFCVDILWLRRHAGRTRGERQAGGATAIDAGHERKWGRWIGLAAAVVLLNASLTFGNIWPTPIVRWQNELSVELAGCILLLGLIGRRSGRLSRATVGFLSAIWVLLIVGRYADVTAPALYGREINLYWDLQYIPDVVSMLATVAPLWVGLLTAVGGASMVYALFRAARWAMQRLATGVSDARERRALLALALVVTTLFAGQRLSGRLPGTFATPVVATLTRQVVLVFDALTGSPSLDASPPMDSSLSFVDGADVLLLFVESYGAVAYERPEFDLRLAPSRTDLGSAIHATGRDVVSAFVESPTFGGGSWLAHLSFMSGIEVREPETYARLMTQKRDTLVTTFRRRGYRTVAWMPGLWQHWPEGAFYGFDDIYGGARLDYRGPPFGWWSIPDQFALAQMDALELSPAPRAPRFIFFPTVSTHTPFTPTPPYQADWRRMLTASPYEPAQLAGVWDEEPDWMNLGPGYVEAVTYAYRAIAGYLRVQPDRDFILILVGDHQPPAAVSGLHANWNVPVHVVASRPAVLERLRARGFQHGLRPSGAPLVRMHAMLPLLLEVFGGHR